MISGSGANVAMEFICNNKNHISVLPYGRNFRGAGSRSDQCAVKRAESDQIKKF